MSEDAPTPARVAVIYYSATGTVHRLAEGGPGCGELRRGGSAPGRSGAVPGDGDLAEPASGKHRSDTKDEPEAELEDLAWADGFAFGTPPGSGT